MFFYFEINNIRVINIVKICIYSVVEYIFLVGDN